MSLFGISGGTSGSGKISNGQAVLILMGVVLSFTAFIFPGPAAELAGGDSYWSPYLATIPSVFQLWVVWVLGRRFAYASPYDYLPKAVGRFLGILVTGLLVMLFVVSGAAVQVQAGLVLASVLMPLTPLQVFTVVTALTAAYVAYLGMETFGRLAQLMMPVLMLVLLLMVVGLIGELDFGFLLPILRQGWRPAWHGASVPTAMRSEAGLVFAFLLPLMQSPRRGFRASILATWLITVFLVTLFVTVICLISPGDAARQTAPILTAVRMVVITEGLEHVEFLVIVPWLIALVLKVSLYTHLASVGIAKIAGARSWKASVAPTAALIAVLSAWMFPNTQFLLLFLTRVWPGYALTMNILLPSAVLAAAIILGRKDGRAERSTDAS
jgi:spore germination protein KB